MEKTRNFSLLLTFLNFLPGLLGERLKIAGASGLQNITTIHEQVIRFNFVKDFVKLKNLWNNLLICNFAGPVLRLFI